MGGVYLLLQSWIITSDVTSWTGLSNARLAVARQAVAVIPIDSPTTVAVVDGIAPHMFDSLSGADLIYGRPIRFWWAKDEALPPEVLADPATVRLHWDGHRMTVER